MTGKRMKAPTESDSSFDEATCQVIQHNHPVNDKKW